MTISIGRDSNYSIGRYEYCIFEGDVLVKREGGYKSAAAARRAAIKAAQG